MKKGAKIGLGIFLGITGVIVALAVTVSIVLFGGRDLNGGDYSAQEKQQVFQKLPVLEQFELLQDKTDDVLYGSAQNSEIELSGGELNALLDVGGIKPSGIAGLLGAGAEEYADKLTVSGSAAEISDSKMIIKVQLGDCKGLTGNISVDNFLTDSVIKVQFVSQDGKLIVDKLWVNNLSSSLIPEFVLGILPQYNGGSIEDYINSNFSGVVDGLAKQIFLAKEIYSIEIKDTTVKISGEFYQHAE